MCLRYKESCSIPDERRPCERQSRPEDCVLQSGRSGGNYEKSLGDIPRLQDSRLRSRTIRRVDLLHRKIPKDGQDEKFAVPGFGQGLAPAAQTTPAALIK